MSGPNITEWLENKSVFVTGASGFIGKVLVEKLLRVSNIRSIYVLVRPKRGTSSKKRWEGTTENPLFDVLKREKPEALDKVVVIEGDVTQIGLGLSHSDRKLLTENVQIIFHSAASVRFDDPIACALKLNTRGTYYMCELAKTIKHLEVFVYVSTAYCNAHLNTEIDEKVYEPAYNWRTLLQVLDDELILELISSKILANHANTYLFTKAHAEAIMRDYNEQFPVVIMRPTVVIPTYKEPIPGWTDNLNGPLILTMGCAKGLVRVFKADEDANFLDLIMVDCATNALVTAAWDRATSPSNDIKVFNCSYGKKKTLTINELLCNNKETNQLAPMDNNIWYLFLLLVKNSFLYHVLFFLLQFLPAVFIDTVLLITGNKPRLLRINVKLYLATRALQPFAVREFNFGNQTFLDLIAKVPEDERDKFLIDPGVPDTLECLLIFQLGMKKYLMNEKDEDLDKFKRKYWRLYVIDRITRALLIAGACFVIFKVTSNNFL